MGPVEEGKSRGRGVEKRLPRGDVVHVGVLVGGAQARVVRHDHIPALFEHGVDGVVLGRHRTFAGIGGVKVGALGDGMGEGAGVVATLGKGCDNHHRSFTGVTPRACRTEKSSCCANITTEAVASVIGEPCGITQVKGSVVHKCVKWSGVLNCPATLGIGGGGHGDGGNWQKEGADAHAYNSARRHGATFRVVGKPQSSSD